MWNIHNSYIEREKKEDSLTLHGEQHRNSADDCDASPLLNLYYNTSWLVEKCTETFLILFLSLRQRTCTCVCVSLYFTFIRTLLTYSIKV